jgi:uncharacterized delta-60 repeat protein
VASPRPRHVLACACAALLLVAVPAAAAPGDLDPAFGTGGKLTTSFGTFGADIEWANAVALQPDGKIVVAGYHDGEFALARYNTGGSLDPTFDGDGRVTTSFGAGANADAWAVVLQADGKIVAAGPTSSGGANSDFALARYNADGALDTTFDGDGKVTTPVGTGSDEASALALQSDGKLVAAGWSSGDFALVRYNADGALDTSFDGDGKLTTAVGAGADAAYGVKVQADGKIVAAGSSSNGANMDVAVVRYASDGSLDAGFDGDGKVTTPIGSSDDEAYALALQADGKIVAAGYSGAFRDFALVRYDTGGALDTTFDGDGKLTTDFATSDDEAWALAVQPDGKLVAAGSSSENFALARYASDGSLDASFDGDGRVTTNFPSSSLDYGYGLAIQPDDRIVLVGSTVVSHTTWGLARYDAGGTLDTTFDGDGLLTTTFAPLSDVEEATAVAVQPDGKLVVAGHTATAEAVMFALARYNPDGSPDPTFDGDGKVTTRLGTGTESRAYAVALQPDGKIVVAGYSQNGNLDFALARYNPNGTLDTSFDGDGRVTTGIQTDDRAWALALQPDGKIVAAGSSRHTSGQIYFAVARYNPDGSPDTTFGGAPGPGWVTVGIGPGNAVAYGVKVQTDGKIVMAGSSSNGANKDVRLVRLLSDGWLDASWSTPIGSFDDEGYALALQPDGKIVVAGYSSNGANRDFALVRYNANTTLDATFDFDGKVTTDIASHDEVRALALQPDGKLVAAGCAGCSSVSGDFALVRYDAAGSLDAAFGAGGKVTTNFSSAIDNAYGAALQTDGKIVAVGGASVVGHTAWALSRYLADGTAPTNPTLTSSSHTVGAWSADSTVEVAFAGAADEWSGVDGFSFSWDGSATTVPDTVKDAEETASGTTSPSLADGSHYVHVRTADRAGNWSGTVHLGPFRIDATAPAGAQVSALAAFQTALPFDVGWSASDAASGVASYDVRFRRAPLAGEFHPFEVWRSGETAARAPFAAVPGSTYCLSARAADSVGNRGGFGPEACTAVPAGVGAFARRGSWTRKQAAARYLGSYLVGRKRGASLSVRVSAKRLVLVATKCRGCGVVEVYLGARRLRRVHLAARETRARQLINLATFPDVRSGRVRIVIVSRNRRVLVEGLGGSRVY